MPRLKYFSEAYDYIASGKWDHTGHIGIAREYDLVIKVTRSVTMNIF